MGTKGRIGWKIKKGAEKEGKWEREKRWKEGKGEGGERTGNGKRERRRYNEKR